MTDARGGQGDQASITVRAIRYDPDGLDLGGLRGGPPGDSDGKSAVPACRLKVPADDDHLGSVPEKAG